MAKSRSFGEWHARRRASRSRARWLRGRSRRCRAQRGEIAAWFVCQLVLKLGLSPTEIDISQPFAYYGLDSVHAIQLMTALEAWLGRKTFARSRYEYPSIDILSGHLAGGAEDPTSAERPCGRRAGPKAPTSRSRSSASAVASPAPRDRRNSGGCSVTGWTPSRKYRRSVGTISTPRERGDEAAGADSSIRLTSSTPSSSASHRAKHREWIRSSDFYWRWRGRHWRMPGRCRNSWQAAAPAFSPASSTNEYGHLTLSRPDLIDAYSGTGNSIKHRGQPTVLLLRLPWSKHGGRHRLLVVFGGHPSGMPEPARRRVHSRARRWRQCHPVTGDPMSISPRRSDGGGRPLQDLRRQAPTDAFAAKAPESSCSSR